MIEVTNKTSGPLQLIVRSRKVARGFTTLVIPGRGKGKNVLLLEDELKTEYIDRLEHLQLIVTRKITN